MDRAAKALRKLKQSRTPGASGLSARLSLAKGDARAALKEAVAESPIGLGGDIILPEATAGLDWPWIDAQIAALANAKLGQARKAAQRLSGIPAGTLPESRAEVGETHEGSRAGHGRDGTDGGQRTRRRRGPR